ncbi:MAG: type IV toxin-antitoxin system AbiEi family antitoxin domain-containing protein [Solirubrobacterales bacterium]
MPAMTGTSRHSALWALARRQHGVLSVRQLREHGFERHAVRHRVASGRLRRVHRGVYAVGHLLLSREARWMAAVLAVGQNSLLSHESAGALWGIWLEGPRVHVSASVRGSRRLPGVVVHRRRLGARDRDRQLGIPVTNPAGTLIDLAVGASPDRLEAAINAADRRGLLTPEQLRGEVDLRPGRPGAGVLRRLLDRRTFRLTDSELERLFLRLAREVGLPPPRTGVRLNGFKVDFHWPGLGLVVETDGLRYHRTPEQQAHDRRRDQAHTAAGLTCLRFTHAQVRYEPEEVRGVLRDVGRLLA